MVLVASIPSIGDVYLDEYNSETDVDQLVEGLKDPNDDVHRNTLRLPSPYTAEDAAWWIAETNRIKQRNGRQLAFAIRLSPIPTSHDPNPTPKLIGGAGFNMELFTRSHDPPYELVPISPKPHRGEIGYYLFKEARGHGIMPKVVEALLKIGFEEIGLARVQANIFHFNKSSGRVLEKCGFQFEGILRDYDLKNGELLDARSYSVLKKDWDARSKSR